MQDGAHYRVKASIFRAYLKWLEKEGKLGAATARVSPDTARLAATPPLASSWMPGAPLDELVEQIESMMGLAGVKRAGGETLRDEISPLLAPMVRNILRLIGASPATIYRRWDDLVKTVMRDVHWEWRSTSDNGGLFTLEYPRGQNVPMRTFCSTIAALEYGLVLAGKNGVVGDPVRVDHNRAEFEIRWA